jgi:hypothetical protein
MRSLDTIHRSNTLTDSSAPPSLARRLQNLSNINYSGDSDDDDDDDDDDDRPETISLLSDDGDEPEMMSLLSDDRGEPSSISSLSSYSYGDDGGDSSHDVGSDGSDDDNLFDDDGSSMIGNMSIFNTKMNDLYVFFKGKIKPNLKIISKNDIQDMYDDMNVLKQNFDDAYKLIDDDYADIFAIDKSYQNKKVDDFIAMFKKNFDKPYSDIINNLKAYSSIGNSTVGGMLITHATRKNMYRNKKYLL